MRLRGLIASLVLLACVAPAAAAHAFTVTPTEYGFYVTVGNTERVEIWHDTYDYADPAVSISDWELPGNPTYIRRHTAGGGVSQPVVILPATSWRQYVVSQVGGSQQVAMNIPPGWPSQSSGGGVSGFDESSPGAIADALDGLRVEAVVTSMPPSSAVATVSVESTVPVSLAGIAGVADLEFAALLAVIGGLLGMAFVAHAVTVWGGRRA